MPTEETGDLKPAFKVLKLETETNAEFLAQWRELPDTDKQELGALARQHLAALRE